MPAGEVDLTYKLEGNFEEGIYIYKFATILIGLSSVAQTTNSITKASNEDLK
jgi:hypothetical protein